MFVNERLPLSVELGSARIDPENENVDIVTMDSGGEVRNLRYDDSRLFFEFAYPADENESVTLAAVVAMFKVCRGALHSFRFRDFTDYEATDELVGTGTGAGATFDLVKNYTAGGQTRTRRIFKPVSPIVIKEDGVVLGAGYTVDYDAGTVTLTSVGAGVEVTWSGTFDIAVRFDSALTTSQLDGALRKVDTISLVEVLDE